MRAKLNLKIDQNSREPQKNINCVEVREAEKNHMEPSKNNSWINERNSNREICMLPL